MMEAWRRRILSEPRLFLFLLWVIFRIRVQRVLLVQQADVVFALFCKIDLQLTNFEKKVIFENMKYQIFCLII